MPIPGVHIETLRPPQQYTEAQLDLACRLAFMLQRGKLILTAPPEGDK